MKRSLEAWKSRYLEISLGILWRQWAQIGVAADTSAGGHFPIDIEALVLTSCLFGRYDQRLFDEMISWLRVNERSISASRLRALANKQGFSAYACFAPISSCLPSSGKTPKWSTIQRDARQILGNAPALPLFLLANGKPLPMAGMKDKRFAEFRMERLPFIDRELASTFPFCTPASLQLQLRSLFGVNSRADALFYLLLHDRATIQQVADFCGCSWRSIQETLSDFSQAGVVLHPDAKRARTYRANREHWLALFPVLHDESAVFIGWIHIFRTLEIVWSFLSDSSTATLSPDGRNMMAAELFSRDVNPRLAQADGNLPSVNLAGIGPHDLFHRSFSGLLEILERFA